MTDKIKKNLAKLSAKEKDQVRVVLEKVLQDDYKGLNLMKLKGSKDLYRVRKGDIRIIFQRAKDGPVKILAIERRTETTYKNY